MINIPELITELQIAQVLSIAIPSFHEKTDISTQMVFSLNKENKALEIGLGFTPREPNEEEYSLLFEEILNAETLIHSEHLLSNIHKYENIKQFEFKLKEEIAKIIVQKQKES